MCIIRYLSYRGITRVSIDYNTTLVAIMQTMSQEFDVILTVHRR